MHYLIAFAATLVAGLYLLIIRQCLAHHEW